MGLTDQHLVYGDDIPQTQIEKDYYWKIKHLEEQNNKLKEAIEKIKEEIDDLTADYNFEGYYMAISDVENVINKHTEGLV